MPKIIDHDQRRLEIVQATEKLIVGGGFGAATMREIAAAAGYANGALKRYFEGKDQILMATSKHVSNQLIARLEKAVEGRHGLDAVAALFEQAMPNQQENNNVARVLMTFWERAIGNPELSGPFRQNLLPWRKLTEKYLRQAIDTGEISEKSNHEAIADELMTLVVGVHVMVQLHPTEENIEGQIGHVRRRINDLRIITPVADRSN